MRFSKKNCISVLGFGLFGLQVFLYCSVLFIKEELFLLLLLLLLSSSSSSLHQKLDLGLEVCLCVLLPLLLLWFDVAS
jgi:hypothetical protein